MDGSKHATTSRTRRGGREPGMLIDSFLCNCAAWLRSAGSLQLHPAGSCTETAPPFPFFLSLFYSLFFSLCLRTDSSSVRHFNTILHILCIFLFAQTHTADCFNLALIRLRLSVHTLPRLTVQVSRDDESCRPPQRDRLPSLWREIL